MSSEPIALRASCLLERARACAVGFRALGFDLSADLTDSFADGIEQGFPPALYEHWIGEQEKRLTLKMLEANNA